MCSSNKDTWIVATQEEFQSLVNNGAWSAVTCPEGAKAIGSNKWVYDIKPNDEPIFLIFIFLFSDRFLIFVFLEMFD